MSQTVHYPINFFSRAVTNASGTSDAYLYFLCHGDRSTVSSGTWFVDHSSWDRSVLQRGSGIIQSQVAAYFSTGGISFSGSTVLAETARIVWDSFDLTYGQGTGPRNAMVFDNFIAFTSLNTNGMYWFDVTANNATEDYFRAFFSQGTPGWTLTLHAYRPAFGLFLSHSWILHTMATGSWMHFAVVVLDSVVGVGSHRIGVFQNGSQLPLVAGGFPSNPNGGWTLCNFALSSGPYIAYGGLYSSVSGSNPYAALPGYMDELHVVLGAVQGLSYDSFFSYYYFDVPSAPYSPADGTYNINFKTLSLTSSTLTPTTHGGLSLGTSTRNWLDLWSSGTAYLNRVGQNYTMVGTTRIIFGTATVYMFSSTSGYLTLVAGTQIDLQANVGMSAVNFIFDTATGVKVATATNQKIGFFGATPIVRPGATTDLKDSLVNLGLITDGGATPLNLDGGSLVAASGSFSGQVSVGGAFYATGYHYKVTIVGSNTTTYSLTTANDFVMLATQTDTSVILPAAALTGKVYFLKNVSSVGTVTVTIGTVASTGIDSASTYVMATGAASLFVDGKIVYGGAGPLSGYTSRQLITVSTDTAIAVGSQASFPLMVRLTSANFNFAHAKSDGADVIFVDTAQNILSHKKIFFGYTLNTTTNVVTGSTVTGDQTGGNWANLSNTTDGSDATFANSFDGAGPHWIRYQLGAAVPVSYVRFKPYSNANGRTAKNFIIEGSNDTSGAWTSLYTGFHRDNAHYESYVFNNTVAYSFYRIYFSDSWQTSGLIGIFEVQMYSNATTQMGVFMVNAPTIAAGTTLYMYFGNSSAADLSGSGAWNSGYAAVWPMASISSDSTGQVADATSYGRHALSTLNSIGKPNLVWNSLWGYVLSFYGSQVLTVSDDSVWDDGMVDFTWTMWILETATGGSKAYIGRGTSGSSYLYWGKDNGAPLRWRDYNGGPDINTLSPSVVTNSVTMITMQRSSNQFTLLKNGTSIGTASSAATLLSRADPLTIGANSSISYFVNGIMWNLQISTVARGTAWDLTKYNSDTDQLIVLGAEATFTAGGGTIATYYWTTFKNA